MTLPASFLDDLRARTTLSALIGRSVKLTRAGSEQKGCCPFHNEKTASFTVSDDKGFGHCFGCGWHGDAIRWLTDHDGLSFMDAVRQLADSAGVEVPARSAAAAEREEKAEGIGETLEAAARWYGEQLAGPSTGSGQADAKILAMLAARGVGAAAIGRFGIGYSPPKRTVASCGVKPALLEAAGLMIEERDGYRDRFRGRIMIPIHDARGRIIGFAARATGDVEPKYLNSPESAAFAKSEVLFNLHRAAPAARKARRLIIVEGQFDAIALDQAGIEEAAAPQGSALTEKQLERAWRVHQAPVLLFDGDAPGRKAALRAAEKAMPAIGPGATLSIATMPDGEDPDSLARSGGREAVEAVLAGAKPISDWLFEALKAEAAATPEGKAAFKKRLGALAGAIRDADTRAQYLAEWMSRFDAAHPPAPLGIGEFEMSPDGRDADLSNVEAAGQARLRNVAAAWLERARESWEKDWAVTPRRMGRWAWELGRRVSAGLIDAIDAEEALDEAEPILIGQWPDVAKGELRRSYDYGTRKGASILDAMLTDMRCSYFNRTDKGNSERWLARYGEDYLYTTAKGWLGWDARRYRVLNQEKDTTPAEVLHSVVTMVEAIQREADFVRDTGWPQAEEIKPDILADLEDDPRRPGGLNRWVSDGKKGMRLAEKLRAWAIASEAAGRINCIAGLAKRAVTVELTQFDTDPMLLNCLNGTLRFIRGDEEGPARVELQPHDRGDRLTRLTAAAYDADAPAVQFQKFVRWAQPDVGRRRYLRQWMGYNLTGDMGEQIFHVWWGPSAANGKSTFGNACREAIGDYGVPIKPEVFLEVGIKKGGDAATPAIVQLPGARCVTSGEPPKDTSIDEALINTITGGDPMQARDNFRSFFTFLPIFKWTLWCNRLPPIPQGTEGIWRRVKVVLWESHLEAHERDRTLPDKLRAELPGILAWMVRGAIDWMEHGFVEPDSVQVASASYKEDSDPLAVFLRTCTVADPQGRVQGSDLYETFCAWAKAAGETEWKPKGFALAMKAKDIAKKHSNGTLWLGINLIKRAGDFVDHEGKVRRLDEEPAADWRPQPPPPVEGDDDPVPGFGDDMP